MIELQPCGTPAAFLRHKRSSEEPCHDCLTAWRSYSNDRQKKRRSQDPEKARAIERSYRARDVDAARAKERAAWHKLSPEQKYTKRRNRQLKSYGLTQHEFDALLAAQNGRCAACSTSDPGRKGWCIDHDHRSHDVRGILCTICNVILGMMGDDLAAAKRYEWALGVRYLERMPTITRQRLLDLRSNPAPIGAGCGAP